MCLSTFARSYAALAVELGYEVFASHRRRRYAYEAMQGVMQCARERHDVHRFVASVSPDNLPSLNLIARFDFRKIGEHVDPVDGVEGIYLRDETEKGPSLAALATPSAFSG